jgi:hypothetical protein
LRISAKWPWANARADFGQVVVGGCPRENRPHRPDLNAPAHPAGGATPYRTSVRKKFRAVQPGRTVLHDCAPFPGGGARETSEKTRSSPLAPGLLS